MIELIETYVTSPDEGEATYRKSLVIELLKYSNDDNRVIILKSRKLYLRPISKKRWKLIEKFKKEGCRLCRSHILIEPNRKYRQRIKLSLEEVIRIGHIYDSNLVEDLKQVDIY